MINTQLHRKGSVDPSTNNQPLQFSSNLGPVVAEPCSPVEENDSSLSLERGVEPNFFGPMDPGVSGRPLPGPPALAFSNPAVMPGGGGPMMGPDPNLILQMFNQFGNWGPMGPNGPGMGPNAGPSVNFMSKEIVNLKSSVLYPPPPGAPIPSTRERPPGCRTIFVGGLPENCTEDMLREVFENCGGIVSIRKAKRNFAHIRFETEDCVDRALYFSGFRMKIENKEDKPNTGRVHVDFALARDDQFEFECKQRALFREMRHLQRIEEDRLRPPSPPPVVHFSEHEALSLLEKLKSDDEFIDANHVLVTWLERGDLQRRNVGSFYGLIQCSNSQVRRLISEKMRVESELEEAKTRFRRTWDGIIQQIAQIERVFSTARKQKNWDHFSKAQRKNLEQWHKHVKETYKQQQEDFLSERVEDEMEMSENEEEEKEKASAGKRRKYDEETLLQQQQQFLQENQVSILKDENDSLKCQLEAYVNEIDILKQEHSNALVAKDSQMKMLQQVLQGMQKQLVLAMNRDKDTNVDEQDISKLMEGKLGEKETEEAQKNLELETKSPEAGDAADHCTTKENEEDGQTSTQPTSSSLASIVQGKMTEKEARIMCLTSCFLCINPCGASVDSICAYLNNQEVSVSSECLSETLVQYPALFQQDSCSSDSPGDSSKWKFIGFNTVVE